MKIKESQLDKLVFFVVVIDLMFLPYIRPLSSSLSMLILPFWFLFRLKILDNDIELKLCAVGIFLIIASFLYSAIFFSSGFRLRDGSIGYPVNMLPNLVVVAYMVLYFLFFKSVILRYSLSVDRYFFYYLIFVSILSLLFFSDPAKYFEIRSFWTMYGNVIEVSDFSSSYRFTSTLSDPNNLSALICAATSFLIFYKEYGFKKKILLLTLTFVIVVASMSTTGLLLFFLVLLLFSIGQLFGARSTKLIIFFKIASVALFLLFFILLAVYVLNTEVGSIAYDRASNNSMDSRIQIWKNSFDVNDLARSFFLGDGGIPVIEGRAINPHSGHLYLIYSYGFIFYFIFVFLFFLSPLRILSPRKIFLIPLFVVFSLNVGIYELRFAGIMALMVAASKVRKSKGSRLSGNVL
jgi:hypothetical protein